MPVNSGPSAGAGLRANAFGFRGGKLNVINGVSLMEPRRDYGTDGPAGVAASGRIDSGGPAFTTSLQRPARPFTQRFLAQGTTYDSAGSPLANCAVFLLDCPRGTIAQSTTSDGSGVFQFYVDDNSVERWAVATNTGVAGATASQLTYTVA